MLTDDQLILECRKGNKESFEMLVQRYHQRVYALAFRYMSNEDDAYDMSQEAFIKAYRALDKFKGNSSFGTWIYRITTNVCLDELRRRKRRISPVSIDEPLTNNAGDEIEKELIDPGAGVDILYEQQELGSQIQAYLNELKPDHRTAIVLRDIMDLSYEEIAEVLNCSIGTVKSRINRARNSLKKKLQDGELL